MSTEGHWPADAGKGCATQMPGAAGAPITLDRFVKRFVESVAADFYQPMYRREPVPSMTPVKGWAARLNSYFWPRPQDTAAANEELLRPIVSRLTSLSMVCAAGTAWSATQERESIDLALAIFKWGGVPQRSEAVTWQSVRAVVDSAVTGTAVPGAPMNSGWTKVAAFATEYLEDVGTPQAIWDSRVSTSIVRRADHILKAAGYALIPDYLQGLGLVGGRGGTRPITGLHFRWPSAYGRWESQFAGSHFIRRARDELNASESGAGLRWTTRAVEMVLFGDGY